MQPACIDVITSKYQRICVSTFSIDIPRDMRTSKTSSPPPTMTARVVASASYQLQHPEQPPDQSLSYPAIALQHLIRPHALVYYLIPASYLSSWLDWTSTWGAVAAVRRHFHLTAGSTQEAPGPLSCRALQHPLLLHPAGDAVAVPAAWYRLVQSIHGVVGNDGPEIYFYSEEPHRWILYHSLSVKGPIEYIRHAIPARLLRQPEKPTTLMEKLLQDEQSSNDGELQVEMRPIKMEYVFVHETTTTNNNNNNNSMPYILVSRHAQVLDVFWSLLQLTLYAKDCIRLWIPTPLGDMALVSDVQLSTQTTLGEWSESLLLDNNKCIRVELETREHAGIPWERKTLCETLSVGDRIDAQDVTGKWFEAVVQSIEYDDKDEEPLQALIHYMGWASKWNAYIPLQPNVNQQRLSPPAPLWTHSTSWRENLKAGDRIEIRDTSSLVTRPKWYTGIVVKVDVNGRHTVAGGAAIERDQDKQPLRLLPDRKTQLLVEVDQERQDKSVLMPPTIAEDNEEDDDDDSSDSLAAEPPHLRWVDAYGEEICKFRTHLKPDTDVPALLQYELDPHRSQPVEIMKSRMGMGFVRESIRGTPSSAGVVGLQNLGNSCFLNSILQCLNHLPALHEYFCDSDKLEAEVNRSNPLGSQGNIAFAYAALLKQLWGNQFTVLAPRQLKQMVASFAPQFDNSYQHDSQEFLSFLLDGLHEDLNRVREKPYVEELEGFGIDDNKTAIESWRKHLLRHDSVIVDHCQGMHRSHLTCPHCGRESIKFDVYSTISLPLVLEHKTQSVLKLEDCLEKFMEGEQLDEKNAWYCPSCRKHVCALKMIALWSVPDILILHLKRFTFEPSLTATSGMLRSKVDLVVEFPVNELDMSKHILGPIDPESPPIYKLSGVSEHIGPTANSGHYTATVRNLLDGQWYRCNDSHVGRTSGEAAITGGAYVLFYQRSSKKISKWGGLAQIMDSRGIDPYGGLETDQDGFTKVATKANRKK